MWEIFACDFLQGGNLIAQSLRFFLQCINTTLQVIEQRKVAEEWADQSGAARSGADVSAQDA